MIAGFATLVTPAFAQDAASTEPAEVEEVVVTGTRIRLKDYTASNPVVSVTGETLEQSGLTNLTEFLQDVPALVDSVDLQDNSNAGDRGSAGINLLNLRNLGSQRTLVLVDGRRHVASSAGSASIDTNTIPVALVDKIEVLTGGASAIYGADGVSGVVNFIMKKDFEGVDARVQTGFTEDGGAESTFGSVLVGTNFHEGRSNFTLGFEYSDTAALERDDRDYARLGNRLTLARNPANTGPADGIPDRIFVPDVRYIDTALGGAVYTDNDWGDSLSGVDFQGDGNAWVDGTYLGGFTMQGGSGTPLPVFQTQIIPGLERGSLNSTFRHEFTDGNAFFAEAKFVRTETQFKSQPTFDYGIWVDLDNPFIPASIVADASAPGGLGGVLVGRDNLDLGEVFRDIRRDTFRTVMGFEGDLSDSLKYEVSYTFGRTEETNTERNNRIAERWFAAIDAVVDPISGETVCRSDLNPAATPAGDLFMGGFDASTWGTTFTPGPNSGCVPVNIFGENISDEARAWINTTTTDVSTISQHVLNGFITGDTENFFSLPGGPISFAFGGEWRIEKSDYDPDDLLELSADLGADITWLGEARRTKGDYAVGEVFGEISVPVLRDLPFAEALTVDAAFRISDYSTSGATETWKYGGQWRLNDSIMFRGTKARSVRAPNISELFTPQVQTFAILDDPCDKDNVNLGPNPANRLANCQAAMAMYGLDPTTWDNTSSSSIEGRVGGNPDLKPEEADTITYGVVLTPSLVPGLSFALDYYDIELENAIHTFSAQRVVDNCYDLSAGNAFCNGLTRVSSSNPTLNGRISGFQQFAQNVAAYRTSGYDFSVRYSLNPERFGIEQDIGKINFSLVGTKLEELAFVEIEGEEPNDDVGEFGSPEWQANFDATWFYQNWTVNYGFTWFDKTIRYADTYDSQPEYVADEYKYFSERFTHDLQVRYDIDDRYTVYGGVNNFTNQEPDLGALQAPVNAKGRYFYLGATAKLGALGDLKFW